MSKKKRPSADLGAADEWVNDETFTLSLERHDLDWTPVRPSSLTIFVNRVKEGVLRLTDNGHGKLLDACNAEIGTINYRSGIVLLPGIPNGTSCLAQYRFDSTAPQEPPKIEMSITSLPIKAKVHKLKKGAKIVYHV